MKKIIVSFLVSLVCFLGYAQTPYPSPNPFGSKGTMTQAQGGWKIDSTAIMPVYADTFAANRSKTSLYPGALIRVSDDYYYRSADTSKWLLLATTTSNCAGTQLISGSITWSGSGLVYDATDLDYYILCSRYFANSTTLTLATADPTYGRIDKFYADNTQNIGVITGTPSANPQEPSVNPLTQIDLGFVYIPAGSTVPAGTTQTVIYNENVEWSGTSNVPSVNFTYGTNPYIGSVSTYLPSAPNSSYVEWQSGGIDYLFSDAQYLKFWVRLNANFVNDPLSFLDVTFEYTDVTVSQTLAVGNGDYNMDYSLINQWQLVSIPLTGITTFGTEFNSVHFVINSAPTSFQLDYVYLLETATVPPAPIGGTWLLNGNSSINDATQYIGTRDAKKLNFGTNGQIRAYIDTAGIELLIDDTTANVLLIDSNGKIRKTYQPTILADAPLYIYTDANNKKHIADTSSSSGGNCGLISGGEVTLIDTTTFNVSAALYCIGNVNYSSLDSVMTLATPGDTVRIDVIGVDTSGSVFKLTGVESVNPSPPSVDATYQLVLSFVLVSTDSITPYNPQLSWSTGGNSGTNPFINFLGTTDDKGFMIKTNNNRSGFIDRVNFSSSWGIEALNTNAGGNNNAVGYGAGFLNSTGSDNNYLGNAAGYTNTTGSRNTAIGGISNYANTSGSNNTAVGYRALQNNQQSGLVAIGYQALQLNTSGGDNTAVGYNALNTNTIGVKNTAVGNIVLNSNTTGEDNTALGYAALRRNTIGGFNTSVGSASFSSLVNGFYNTGLGFGAGSGITTGELNTFVGGNASGATNSTDTSGAFGFGAIASSNQMAFSPYFTTMFLNLDSASGTAPAIAGIDENGNWRKYATPSGGSPALTNTYVGVGNVSNAVSGSDQFTSLDSNLSYKGRVSVGTNNSMDGNFNMAIGRDNVLDSISFTSLAVGAANTIKGLGANVAFGELNFIDTAEASSVVYGYNNVIGANANDALAGGTGTSVFALAGIGLGLAHEVNGEASVIVGGNFSRTYGVESGVFAGYQNSAHDSSSGVFAGSGNSAYGKNTVILGGHNIISADDNTAYVENFVATANARFTGLPTSGTYSKSLAIDASGNIYKKDTLAVSGVYLPIASPTFTGTLSSISGGISVGGSIVGSIGLFSSGVRAGNNTNFYWNSGPAILGNTNDITFKNAAATAGANVSIGTSAAAKSAILDITSTVKGVLLPRMTSAQRDAISSPATGLTLFCTDCTATDASTGVMQTYNGSDWKNNW